MTRKQAHVHEWFTMDETTKLTLTGQAEVLSDELCHGCDDLQVRCRIDGDVVLAATISASINDLADNHSILVFPGFVSKRLGDEWLARCRAADRARTARAKEVGGE